MLLTLLVSLGLAVAGLCGYVIFGVLSYRHLQDRGASVGASGFDPEFLRWLLAGRYRFHSDPMLASLAAPARWLLMVSLLGVLGVIVWLLFQAGG